MKVKELADLLTQMCNVPEIAESDVVIFDGRANWTVTRLEVVSDGVMLRTD